MSAPDALLRIHDMDLMRSDTVGETASVRLRKLGFPPPEPAPLERQRERLVATLDRRWLHNYERAQARYGRAVAVVRGRVCQGCFITLPTSAAPSGGEAVTLCESCGRILYWR